MKNNVREDVSSVSKMLFNRIRSGYKQHAIIKFIGDTGLGKSYALLGILERISFLMENHFGGCAEDYFNIDNVAIITQDEIKRVVRRFKKHGIYDFDDFGAGANARRAMTDENIILNDIVSTFRPNENILGMTVPKNRMIDVVQRELAHYNVEMSDPFFNIGFSTGTLFIPEETSYGTINTYPIWNNQIYKRHVFCKPSDKLLKEYDERREEISKEHEVESISVYGLKTETKRRKTIADAEKVGIKVFDTRNKKEAIDNSNIHLNESDIDSSLISKPPISDISNIMRKKFIVNNKHDT